MGVFIIGDVHGCYHTFLALLEFWSKEEERLIQIGDLIDRGSYSPKVLQHAMILSEKYPNQTSFLKGNHEQMMIDHLSNVDKSNWLFNGGESVLLQFKENNLDPVDFLPWLKKRSMFWENKHIYASHAGISDKAELSSPHDLNGLLWNRAPLKNIRKLQIIGHTPIADGQAVYTASSNSWNIDTGAYKGNCLTGIKLSTEGNFRELISIPTITIDLQSGS
jgi:serine/threonine protein phosphatase 1